MKKITISFNIDYEVRAVCSNAPTYINCANTFAQLHLNCITTGRTNYERA